MTRRVLTQWFRCTQTFSFSCEELLMWFLSFFTPTNPTQTNPHLKRHICWRMIRAKQVAHNYPLVNSHITMENHHFQWENPL